MAAYSSQQITYGRYFLNLLAAAFAARPAGALIASGKLRLTIATAFLPDPGATIATLAANEANFSGYPAGGVAVALSGPVNLSGNCIGEVQEETFIGTTATPFVPNIITGYWVDDGTGVVGMEAIPSPGIPINNVGDFLALLVQLPLQATQLTQ
jgi:hypothetical protein